MFEGSDSIAFTYIRRVINFPSENQSFQQTGLSLFALITLILLPILAGQLNFRQQPAPNTQLSHGHVPIIGVYEFFSRRYDFFMRATRECRNNVFSFYVGKERVIGMTGSLGRSVFFDSKELDFAQGYSVLLGVGPRTRPEEGVQKDQFSWIINRLTRLQKSSNFSESLPDLVHILQGRLDSLRHQPQTNEGCIITDPFESLYDTVFHLT